MSLNRYEKQFTELNVNRTQGHRSPHKACLLLAVIDLVADGSIKDNHIYFDDKLKKKFTSYFNRFRNEQDRDKPHLPFFHLRSESFWHHRVRPDQMASYGSLSTASGPGVIEKHINYAYLDEELFELLKNQFVRKYLAATLESTLTDAERRDLLLPGKGWDWLECELTVQSYFSMLDKELRGERYNKAEYRRNLKPMLRGRSEASIEFKHQNISAILIELGYPYINGYKPAYNYQQQLRETVEVYLVDKSQRLIEESESFIESEMEGTPSIDWASILEDAPEREEFPTEKKDREFNPRKYNFAERESVNRKLGEAGEAFVIDYERNRMERAGREDLIEEIEWTSKDKGDGAGYDIRSFKPERDEELFIEVKTTNSGKYQPFYISENEVAFANQNAIKYALYRVFQFKTSPRIFRLNGKPSDHVHLIPKSYKAIF
ncbi:MAG TPA: DUF3883 domain-containing protein [Gammaproteobacteria bacterium]|nr:DUF3883 domain-containing protein [Gammaproteobacteria bacterium]